MRSDRRREKKAAPIFSNKGSKFQGFKKLGTKIKNLKTWQKIMILVLMICLVVGGIVGTMVYGYFKSAVDKMNDLNEDIPENYDLSIQPVDGYINLLLLGVDSRDMNNIKGTRSDMIMVASINTETNDVTLTSIYRDTYLKLGDTTTYDKITHACVYGGPEMTMKSLNQAMDIDLENFAIVNFKAVADVVDAVGGIKVDVQQGEIQQLNKYTKQTARNIGRKKYKLVTEAGKQKLEGVQAVSYGRIRKGVGDDFKRTERMRIVVSKVLGKLKKMSFGEIKDIVDMMIPQVKTNLKMNDILALGLKLPKYSIKSGSGWPYNWTCGLLNKVSYVFPANMIKNTVDFHKEVFGNTEYTPSATVNEIGNTIISRLDSARASNTITGEKAGTSQVTKPTETKPAVENPKEEPKSGTEKPNTDTPKENGEVEKPNTPAEPETPNVPVNPETPDPNNGAGTGETGGTPSPGTDNGTGAGEQNPGGR